MKIVGHSYGITDRKSHHPIGTHTFIGIDGEGINLPSGEHRYVMLSIGNEPEWTIVEKKGLRWERILEHLYAYHLSHDRLNVAYVGFYLGYDFDRWLCTMPENKVTRLITSEGLALRKKKNAKGGTTIYPVDLPYGWQVKMIGKKKFDLRRRSCNCDSYYCKHPKDPWMYICDAGPFFQTSFLKAIDPKGWQKPIVSAAEYELIKKGKDNRANATEPTEEMAVYNRLENEVLARLMGTLNIGFKQMGISLAPGKWFGPGQSAQAWMKNNDVPNGKGIRNDVPEYALNAARDSYFGGWFEIMMHGYIPGESHEYDINSAYPYVISSLPCLLHGKWRQESNSSPPDTGYVLVRAFVSSHRKGKTKLIGTMLHREKRDTILRPDWTEGWFWLHEINAARKAGMITHCHIHEWISYAPCNCLPPLRDVVALYDKRLLAGKDTPLGKSAKLAYNSMYGKFAQSIGEPIYANSIYASLITAGCRTMILDAIATHPKGGEHVAMIATDAVYFVTPHPSLPQSKKLGEWEHKVHSGLTLFKPGVYWNDETRADIKANRDLHFKSRGAPAAAFATTIQYSDATFGEWHTGNIKPAISYQDGMLEGWPIVKFKINFSMVSCLQAIRRGRWQLAGEITQDEEVMQNSNPYRKRLGAFPNLLEDGRIVFRSFPRQIPISERKSKPYQKQFGMEDPWSDLSMEKIGLHPDGPIGNLIQENIGLR